MGRTVILVASDNTVMGLIAIADEVRPGTVEAIATLKQMGMKNITMLTGDNATGGKSGERLESASMGTRQTFFLSRNSTR